MRVISSRTSDDDRRPRRGTGARAALGVVLLAAVGACAADEPPPRPELRWVDGEPTGALEADPWVQAVREAEFAYAWAASVADFSLPALTSTWRDFAVRNAASQVEFDVVHRTPRIHVGPQAVLPLAVDVSEDGRRAEVAACVGAPETRPPVDDGNRWPNVGVYSVELGDDGHRRITGVGLPLSPYVLPDGAVLTPEYCDPLSIPRAVFVPEPDLEALSKKRRDDVVLPSASPSPT